MFKKIFTFFDKLEDRTREYLSKRPILYTLIGGVAIVLFWRGVWHTADILAARGGWLGVIFYEPVNLVITAVILLATGLFVSYFIGDTILLSGLKHQKKVADKTEKETREEEGQIIGLQDTIREMKEEVDEIRDVVRKDHKK